MAAETTSTPPEPPPEPPPGSRPEHRVDLLIYVLAAVSYVGVGIVQKAVLNWIIGPLWLIAFVAIAHRILDRRTVGRRDVDHPHAGADR